MRLTALTRLAALAGAIALIIGCDSRSGTSPYGGSTDTGPTPGQKGPDDTPPSAIIDSPTVGKLFNVGDSILVSVRLHDNSALSKLDLVGLTVKGSDALGTLTRTPRYTKITVPNGQSFRGGLRDTTIRRYLQPVVPVDSTLDSLIVMAIVSDSAGNIDTVTRRVNIVSGPVVEILTPIAGDSVPAGVAMTVSARATHPDGIGSISIRVRGEAIWPTRLDTTITQTFANIRDATFTGVVNIPANATLRSKVTIDASAVDANRQPGNATPVVVFVRAANNNPPRVTQVVPPRMELIDSITVNATGDGIKSVGYIIEDSTGALLRRDSLVLTAPYTANAQKRLQVTLTQAQQGKRISVTSFAWDQSNRIGYSVKTSTTAPTGTRSAAWSDTSLVVFGRTYTLPRPGVAGDIAVDPVFGHVFVSNTDYNLLEVWQNSTQTFSTQGVAVGSLPWGLAIGNSPDTLLVANSGATTISRVAIGNSDPTQIKEALTRRIRTRNTYNYIVTFTRSETGKISMKWAGPYSYSDRPQYVQQSAGGRIFYSTRPTQTNPAGTLRWLDPALPVPDPRQIWQYGLHEPNNGSEIHYALFNVDSIRVGATLPTSIKNDTLYIWDHPYGQASGTILVSDSVPVNAVSKAVAGGSDAELVQDLDLSSLAMTDTTFVSASVDRNWIGFGEGNVKGTAGRIMMVNDPPGVVPKLFSPMVTVYDLTDNASEKVFGIAIDQNGLQVASHGLQTYFAAVDDPFHLRLEGKFDSFDNGAGIAFHPRANTVYSANADRVAFVANSAGSIEIVDVSYYISRGRLLTKNGLYGPLRASLPLPGDPANVVLKLYGLTANGLVVIDLTAADIKPGP